MGLKGKSLDIPLFQKVRQKLYVPSLCVCYLSHTIPLHAQHQAVQKT